MKAFQPYVVTNTLGIILRTYALTQPDADWDIIFIHGTPASGAIFGEQFLHPFPKANLVTFDRPGFGKSKPDVRKPGLAFHAEAVGTLLHTNRRTILVGHPYGAPVAIAAALQFTNQVAGLVLVGGSVDRAQETIYRAQRWADWPAISWLFPRALRQCNRELLTLRDDLRRLQPELARLNVPVVMVHGAKDRQVPVANVEFLRGKFALAGKSNLFEALVYPEANHFIPWKRPEALEAGLQALTNRIAHSAKTR